MQEKALLVLYCTERRLDYDQKNSKIWYKIFLGVGNSIEECRYRERTKYIDQMKWTRRRKKHVQEALEERRHGISVIDLKTSKMSNRMAYDFSFLFSFILAMFELNRHIGKLMHIVHVCMRVSSPVWHSYIFFFFSHLMYKIEWNSDATTTNKQ